MFGNFFNQDQGAALFRTIIQMGSAALVTRGVLLPSESAMITEVGIPALVGLGTTLWGVWARNNKNLVTSAANVPDVKKILTNENMANAVPSDKVVTPNDFTASRTTL